MDDRLNVLSNERNILRSEILSLKQCQVHYFWGSVTAAGALLGLGSKLGSQDSSTLFYLAPLVIILPCWLIFFDKATTITRIVGYSRLLEYLIINPIDIDFAYIGWENALSLFRSRNLPKPGFGELLKRFFKYLTDILKAIPLLFSFKSAHRYWSLNWLTFFGVSTFCWSLGFFFARPGNVSLLILFGILLFISSLHNLYLLKNLINGKFSYNSNEETWKNILKKEGHKYLSEHFQIN